MESVDCTVGKTAKGTVDAPVADAKLKRCHWAGPSDIYRQYHDEEWGVPEYDSQALFERLVLEGMQAGLSWLTVLQKRERMRERFFGFEVARLSKASERSLTSWLKDPGLIRHRGKLEAMVSNARVVGSLDRDLSSALWGFVDNKPKNLSAPAAGTGTGNHAGGGCHGQVVETTRVPFCWTDNMLRIDAECRVSERSLT